MSVLDQALYSVKSCLQNGHSKGTFGFGGKKKDVVECTLAVLEQRKLLIFGGLER